MKTVEFLSVTSFPLKLVFLWFYKKNR